ncbi:hypothetical protein GCM10020367_70520 [Streptomyces sannanensis]|uniref:Uncharacterized protein n=1 Tax=Streptomyces sannanensis TaxID=285536 RepID=A0ABP6SPL0_9ACTN
MEISRVQYDSPTRRPLQPFPERQWVELTNPTRERSTSRAGLSRRVRAHLHRRRFHLNGRATVRSTPRGPRPRTDLFQTAAPTVNNDRDITATLRNDRGRFVDDHSGGRHGGRH